MWTQKKTKKPQRRVGIVSNKKDLKDVFSKRLKDLMTEKGISQNELARGVDTTQQTIQQYLAKEAAPKMETFVAISDFLGVSCDYLFGRVETRSLDINIQDVVNKYGLNEISLNKLEHLAVPEGKAETTPPIKLIHCEEPTPDELAKIVALNLRDKKRVKNALKMLNNIISWKDAVELLSRLHEFVYYKTPSDEHTPIQLTQNGHTIDYELEPNKIHEVIFSMVKEAIYRFRDDLSMGERVGLCRQIKFKFENPSDSKPDTKTKFTKKTTAKKKSVKDKPYVFRHDLVMNDEVGLHKLTLASTKRSNSKPDPKTKIAKETTTPKKGVRNAKHYKAQ